MPAFQPRRIHARTGRSRHSAASLPKRPLAALAAVALLPVVGSMVPSASADVQNLLTADQQSFEASLTGWRAETGAVARVTTVAFDGLASMRLRPSSTATTAADVVATTSTGKAAVPATVGRTYAATVRLRPGTTARAARCELRFYKSGGALLARSLGTNATEAAGAWTQLGCAATAPTGAARVALAVRVLGVAPGESHFADDAWLYDQAAATPTTTIAPSTTTTVVATPPFAYRVAAGSGADVTTADGATFLADRDYAGGTAWGPTDVGIGNTVTPLLYQSNRWGPLSYNVPVPASGTYTVRLHFAEVVFSTPGMRVFDVAAEGSVRLGGLDIEAAAGYANALVRQFDVNVTDGTLNLDLRSVVEDPMISGIEVLNATGTSSNTTTTTAPAAPTTTTVAPATTPTTAAAPVTTTTAPATTPTTAPSGVSGTMPTAANTGPTTEPSQTISADQAIAAHGASNKVITGGITVQDWNGAELGKTWTFSDCVIRGTFYFLVDDGTAGYPLSQYPTVNITRCRIEGSFVFIGAAYVNMDDVYVTAGAGMVTPCPNCAGSTYGLVREMPWVVKNSFFSSPPGAPSSGYHTEGMHIAGSGQGFQFFNTRFVQEGPVNGTQTGALFMHAGRSTFDGCWFDDGDQGVSNAYYFTVYAYGTGPGANQNVIKNSHIENGMGWYVYPGGSNDPVVQAAYTGDVDFHTGAKLTLP